MDWGQGYVKVRCTKITALQQGGSGEGEEVRGRTVQCDVQQESKLCCHDAQNSSHLPRGA